MQPTKCVTQSSQGLNKSISLPLGFFTPTSDLHILGAPLDFLSFVESFVSEALQDNFNTMVSLPMLTNFQATFAMLSFCYPNSQTILQRIVFPSPNILHHYTKFDVRTIIIFKRLLRLGSFDTRLWAIWLIVRSLFMLLQGGQAFPQWSNVLPSFFKDVGL